MTLPSDHARIVPEPHENHNECNSETGFLLVELIAIPMVIVNINPVPVRRGPLGDLIDVLSRDFRRHGMSALSKPENVVSTALTSWCMTVTRGTDTRPAQAQIFLPDGISMADGIRGASMWEKQIVDWGNRAVLFYAPGMAVGHLRDATTGDGSAMSELMQCARRGWLLGGVVPVRWAS